MGMYLKKLYFSIIIYLSCVSRIHCQEATSCFDEFIVNTEASTLASFSPVSETISSLIVTVFEATEVGDILYNISWKDSLPNSPYTDENNNDTVLAYAEIVNYETLLSVELINSLIGIVDYIDDIEPQTNLELTLYFEFPHLPSTCVMNIRHDLLDNNTQVPNFSLEEYELTLGEDSPVPWYINNFQPMSYDLDEKYPNNFYHVEPSPGCPLKPLVDMYICDKGVPNIVGFALTDQLDYDTMEEPYQITCILTLTDYGDPPLMSNSTTITITVTPIPDENPIFTSDFYQGTLDEPLADSMVDVDPPIEAVDPDMPPSDYIVYSMVSADNKDMADEYFSINDTTGEVTVIQDIDNDFLSLEIVTFILTACDLDDQCSNAYLSINLPPQSLSESLEFEKELYSSQILSPQTVGVVVEQVHAESSVNQDGVRYSFDDDGSLGLEYFSINEITGEITNTKTNISSTSYNLKVVATDETLYARTTVNIEIVSMTFNDVIVQDSIVFSSFPENHLGPIYTINGIGAYYYCILNVQPEEYSGHIVVNDTGTIYTTHSFDCENSALGNNITIKAAAYSKRTVCVASPISPSVLSNEVLIELKILDEDEYAPVFYYPNGESTGAVTYYYPLDVSLQKAICTVATIMAKDLDFSDYLITYYMDNKHQIPPSNYKIDYYSGDVIYNLAKEVINYQNIYVQAHSNLRESMLYSYVNILQLQYISTLYFNHLNQSELANKISEISVASGVNVYLLYSSLVVRNDGSSAVEAHVYCTCLTLITNYYGYQLCDREQLISYTNLTDYVSDIQPFTDEKYYTPEDDDDDDFKTSTIVLGCITGLLLALTVAFVMYELFGKETAAEKAKKQALRKGITNTDFKDDYNDPVFENIFEDSTVDGNVIDSTKRSTTSDNTRSSNVVVVVQEPSESLDSYNSRPGSNANSTETLETIDAFSEQPVQNKSFIYPSLDDLPNLSSDPNARTNEIHDAIDESIELQSSQYITNPYSSLDNTNPIITETFDAVETSSELQPVPLIYPSLDSLDKYGETEPNDNLEGSYGNEMESFAVATAPELEEVDSEIESIVSSDKRSNLKTSKDSDEKSIEDEEKSVAFKVLVDTMEFEPEHIVESFNNE